MRTVQQMIKDALTLQQEGRGKEAAFIYDKLLGMLDEPEPSLLMGYGCLLAQDNWHGLAKHLMMQAVKTAEPYAPLYFNLGVSLIRLDREEAAEEAFRESLRIDPKFAFALAGMASLNINSGTPKEAEKWAKLALEVAPELPTAHNELAQALLEQGRFEEAWPHYEYRWALDANIKNKRPYTVPKWTGGKVGRLAIHGEQGLGDEILYMSVFDKVKPLADQIVIECAPRLIPLFERSFGVPCYPNHDELMAREHHVDAWISMGSLFAIAGLPDGKPFLKAKGPFKSRKPIVGISWKGGLPRTHKKHRTVKLEQLRPILDIKGIDFMGIQYGGDEVKKEADAAGLNLVEDRSLDGFISWIASCDLIITVCQTNVHIAGGLGKKCWVLTPEACAWRYSGRTDRMRFYDSVRLYRQQKDQEWSPVVAAIAADLRRLNGA